MIKRTITVPVGTERPGPNWLSLDEIAEVEITSEDPAYPIESALVPDDPRGGWRAAGPGEQTIRVVLPQPVPVRHVRVVVEESERERTQQFTLRVATVPHGPWRDVARQQFTFSPRGAAREEEDYRINAGNVAALELTIVPDISGGDARASLRQFRVA